MKQRIFIVIFSVLVVLAAFAEEVKLPRLAVVEFSINDSKNSKLVNDAAAVRSQVEANVVKLGRYDVIARSEIDKLLENQQIQASSISEKANLKKLELLNIAYLITGDVMAMDNDYLVTLKILDVATGKFVNSDEEFMGNSSSDTYQGVKVLVSRFLYNLTGSGEIIVSSNKKRIISISESFVFVEGGFGADFEICKHEVTQKEYASVMGNNPSYHKNVDTEKYPVECVSWFDAIEYCNKRSLMEGLTPCYSYKGETNTDVWLTEKFKKFNWQEYENIKCDFTSNGYRLPTTIEWRFAATGGSYSNGYEYSGSNDIDEVAWYGYKDANVDGNSGGATHEVMTKQPNELGIYDMSGNVAEWCWDIASLYNRSYCGGVCDSYAWTCSVSNRDDASPGRTDVSLGFRVVRSSSN